MFVKFLPDEIPYDGSQLAAGWCAARCPEAPRGDDLAVAFLGPCDVRPEHMVDLEDLRAGAVIYSTRMVHVICDHAGADPVRAVLRQRLLACLAADAAARLAQGEARPAIERRGDDLFDGGRKLSISIATVAPEGGAGPCGEAPAGRELIHFAVNVRSADYPLPVKGIADYGVPPVDFALALLEAYRREMESVGGATRKVRPVGIWREGDER